MIGVGVLTRPARAQAREATLPHDSSHPFGSDPHAAAGQLPMDSGAPVSAPATDVTGFYMNAELAVSPVPCGLVGLKASVETRRGNLEATTSPGDREVPSLGGGDREFHRSPVAKYSVACSKKSRSRFSCRFSRKRRTVSALSCVVREPLTPCPRSTPACLTQ